MARPESLIAFVSCLFGRDPMKVEQERALKIARETGGEPAKIAEAYGVKLPQAPKEGEEADGS